MTLNKIQKVMLETDVVQKIDKIDGLESSLADIVTVNVKKYSHLVVNGDWADAIQTAINENSKVFIPPGTYLVSKPIIVGTQKEIHGAGGNLYLSQTIIKGEVATMGENKSIFQCLPTGATNNVQSIKIKGIKFLGDNQSVQWSTLNTSTDSGVNGIDVAGTTQGVTIEDCSFVRLKRGIAQRNEGNYTDKITINKCFFSVCYRAIGDLITTVPLSLIDSFIYDCYDWIVCERINVVNTSFNNSSFSFEYCGIKGKYISVDGGWFEGGNNHISTADYVGGSIFAKGVFFSTSYSALGNTKHHFRVGNQGKLIFKSCRLATNNRIASFVSITDWSKVYIEMDGNEINTDQWADSQNPYTLGATIVRDGKLYKGNIEQSEIYTGIHQGGTAIASGTKINSFHHVRGIRLFNPTFKIKNSSADTYQTGFLELILTGANDGAGADQAYFQKVVIAKGMGSVWSVVSPAMDGSQL
ncbi:MAG: Pectate lyase superfamily protein, partial [Neobacillus sp.]|nr:Pectate lyase superfamily protein [Neobacillus sp.]